MMKVLILTNGEYGDYGFCLNHKEYDYIICADKGMMHARHLGLKVDLIVGDFDSVASDDLAYYKTQGATIESFAAEKDETDTELAVLRAIERGATEVDIYGGVGTRLDHTLANVQLLYKLLKHSIKGCLLNPYNKVYLAEKYFKMKGKKGDLVSLIPFSESVKGVTTEHLAYPLKEAPILLGSSLGISNYLLEEEAYLTISEGILIVIMARD